MSNKFKMGAIIAACAITMVGFQNCSDLGFSEKDDTSHSFNSATGTPSASIGETQTDGNLLQIDGSCASNGGAISVGGDLIVDNITQCLPGVNDPVNAGEGEDGSFRLCTRLLQPGDINVQLTQINSFQQIFNVDFPAFTTVVSVEDLILTFLDINVVSSSQGEITIRCVPGAIITSDIYGNPQIQPTVCTAEGTITFTVALVPSLVNTGQRVVTVRQEMQNGTVTEIFIDVDNVASNFNCSIESGQANTDICVDDAGTVSGTCAPGLPVEIYVDDQLQDVVICGSDGSYDADNVLLSNLTSEHEIRIEQQSPFSEVKCTASRSVENIADLNN